MAGYPGKYLFQPKEKYICQEYGWRAANEGEGRGTAAEYLLFLICMPALAKINLPIIAYTIMAVVLVFGVYLSGCYAVYRIYARYVPAEQSRALNAEIKKARRDAVLRKILLAAMLCIILVPRIWQELG